MACKSLQVCLVVLMTVFCCCQGACTYAELDFDLYDCFDSRSITTEYALPVMSSSFNALAFCLSHLTNINSCVESAIQACSANSNVTMFFGDGTTLSSAYTYLCDQYEANSRVEPFDCAVNVSASSIKGNLSAFDASVDALSSPTLTEICLYAEVMTAGFTIEIISACSGSPTSLTIWNTFSSMVKSACTSDSGTIGASLAALVPAILTTIFKFYDF